jgi:hypothetical protein
MSEPLIFNPRVVTARKAHKCWACLSVIPAGFMYVVYPGVCNTGEFRSTKLCSECSFLLTRKTGAHARFTREGEFTDRLIPNFLRKERVKYRANPRKAIEDAGLLLSHNTSPAPVKACKRIVVKASELDRRVFHVPESRYKKEQFSKGAVLEIRAGVSGRGRNARIVGAWSTDGSAFGCPKRQVAILVA